MRLDEMEHLQFWRNVRTGIRWFVYVLFFAAIASVPIALLLPRPDTNFVDLPADRVQRLIAWSDSIDTSNVQRVSHHSNSSRDSHSTWLCIKTDPKSAQTWMDHIHDEQEKWSLECIHELHEGLEGVHHTIFGEPPMNWQTGENPTWWNPPRNSYRTTEVMLWYDDYDSGVGRATYSGYDTTTSELWIYEYASQHDKLWMPGNRPTGTDFSTVNPTQ